MASSVEQLEALLDPETREVKYLMYMVSGLGSFLRKDGKWVVAYEETDNQFEDLPIIDLDPSKSMPLIEKWDTGEGVKDDDLQEYALPEEEDE
jgi:hypothetical protein